MSPLRAESNRCPMAKRRKPNPEPTSASTPNSGSQPNCCVLIWTRRNTSTSSLASSPSLTSQTPSTNTMPGSSNGGRLRRDQSRGQGRIPRRQSPFPPRSLNVMMYTISSLFNQLRANFHQSGILATLLPKLLSGELSVAVLESEASA